MAAPAPALENPRVVVFPVPRKDYQAAKRILDFVLVVALAGPVLLVVGVCALAILCTMGRPVFFIQNRIGLHGKVFQLWKLRSMISAERRREATAEEDQDRITPLGRFLRRFRLDELPQLLNVAQGEMSFIGPRPEQPGLVEQYRRQIPGFDRRHRVLPGITGLAQVTVGYCANAAETRRKLRMDMLYIRRMSFWLDCKIVWRSVLVVLSGYGSR